MHFHVYVSVSDIPHHEGITVDSPKTRIKSRNSPHRQAVVRGVTALPVTKFLAKFLHFLTFIKRFKRIIFCVWRL
jgi:hypothetical protein